MNTSCGATGISSKIWQSNASATSGASGAGVGEQPVVVALPLAHPPAARVERGARAPSPGRVPPAGRPSRAGAAVPPSVPESCTPPRPVRSCLPAGTVRAVFVSTTHHGTTTRLPCAERFRQRVPGADLAAGVDVPHHRLRGRVGRQRRELRADRAADRRPCPSGRRGSCGPARGWRPCGPAGRSARWLSLIGRSPWAVLRSIAVTATDIRGESVVD